MLINKSKDMTPFDMRQKPAKQYPFLLPIIWGGSYIATRPFGLKIKKINMEGIKPPYLVLSTHQGFSDYYIGPLVFFPHRGMYVSDMEGYAGYGKWLYRGLGCIGKRRYVPDISVMNNIKYAFSVGQSVMLFPESRHSNIGTTAKLPDNLGRLAKIFKVPLVTVSVHGSYLANPFWDEGHTRKVPMEVTIEGIGDADQLAKTSAEELQTIIEEKLTYDEYAYQHERGFLIDGTKRAEGLEKALYQCRSCGTKYKMSTQGSKLKCSACGKSWELSENGWLVESREGKENSTAQGTSVKSEENRIHPPHWYEWQREKLLNEVEKVLESRINTSDIVKDNRDCNAIKESVLDKYFTVQVEALPSEKGFIDLGVGSLKLDSEKFVLQFRDVVGKECTLEFPHKSRESLQTEYDYRGKGMGVVLSTQDCCYYLYSKEETFQVTELQFLAEYLYDRSK